MAKARKAAVAPAAPTAAPTLGAQLAQVAAPAAPAAPAKAGQADLYVMGKRYRVKAGTKHAHDQHWDLIVAALVNGPQSFSALAALGTTVHASNATPYVRYCVRRGWLVPHQPQA